MQLHELNIPKSGINFVVDEVVAYLQTLTDGNGKRVFPVVDRRLESKSAQDDPSRSPAVHIIHNLAQDDTLGVQMYDLALVRKVSFYIFFFENDDSTVQQNMENLFMFFINALQDAKFQHTRDLWKWNNPQHIVADFTDAMRKYGTRYAIAPPWYCFRVDLNVHAKNISINA